jgi:hypothetical protein
LKTKEKKRKMKYLYISYKNSSLFYFFLFYHFFLPAGDDGPRRLEAGDRGGLVHPAPLPGRRLHSPEAGRPGFGGPNLKKYWPNLKVAEFKKKDKFFFLSDILLIF